MKQVILIIILLTAHLSYSQTLEFSDLSKLPESVNTEAEEINPVVTEDGQTLYFTKAFSKHNRGGVLSGQDIWYTDLKEGQWNKSSNLKKFNNGDNNALVGVNESGNVLYMINNYTAHPRRLMGLVTVSKDDSKDGWGSIEELPIQVEVPNDHYGFYMTPDEQLVIISMEGEESLGQEDLYLSHKLGDEWQQPVHMGSVVNSTGFEISPFISKDKKFLFFSTDGREGEGDADIFYSRRLDDSWTNWSTPVNAGKEINSDKFDAYLTLDNSNRAFFSSNRGENLSDIYTAQMTVIMPEDTMVEQQELAKADMEPLDDTATGENKGVEEKPLPEVVIVYFAFDKKSLTSEAKSKLDNASKAVAQGSWTLMLEGHADVRGASSYNQRLSESRTESVATYLKEKGVDSAKIKTQSYGETQPVSESDHAQNRRVKVTFVK